MVKHNLPQNNSDSNIDTVVKSSKDENSTAYITTFNIQWYIKKHFKHIITLK